MSDRHLHHSSRSGSNNSTYYYTKRVIDMVFALVALTTLLPLVIIIALLIKITTPGPIFLLQPRIGAKRYVVKKNGRKSIIWKSVEFQIYRFRTAYLNATPSIRNNGEPANQSRISEQTSANLLATQLEDEPMISPFGRLLRWANIDELPQLINVLLGDMSIVGPYPLPIDNAITHQDVYNERLTVLPGMTGLSQLENRLPEDFDSMVDLDIRYVHSCSIWLDVKIMLLTIPAALSRRPS